MIIHTFANSDVIIKNIFEREHILLWLIAGLHYTLLQTSADLHFLLRQYAKPKKRTISNVVSVRSICMNMTQDLPVPPGVGGRCFKSAKGKICGDDMTISSALNYIEATCGKIMLIWINDT